MTSVRPPNAAAGEAAADDLAQAREVGPDGEPLWPPP
jgi:hypothetical protein